MNVNYFLGANSGDGFYSLYDGFCSRDDDFLYLIKAGPGGGKSGFMRSIAAAAADRGYDTRSVLCSGDPDSLDGVYIPALKVGFMDATAPHVREPRYFGFDSSYVNLGRFCERIYDKRIAECTDNYRAKYKKAYAYLSAAAALDRAEKCDSAARSSARESAKRDAAALTGAGEGRSVTKLFLRCIGCKGEMVLKDDIKKLCGSLRIVDRSVADDYLREILAHAHGNIIAAPSPLCPEKLDAVLLPSLSVGFISSALSGDEDESEKSELMSAAMHYLKGAKAWHDELEKVYNPHVDFDALHKFTERTINKLFDGNN